MIAEPRLVVVTATTDADRFKRFNAALANYQGLERVPTIAVAQAHVGYLSIHDGLVDAHPDYLGVVPAFARGVQLALRAYPQAEVICCLHDDMLMREDGWDRKLLSHFDNNPSCGLAGFGGAWGLGDVEAGKGEYRPTWLVRRGFMSNMPDAEVHGERSLVAQPVAVLDGFSLCFRRKCLTAGNPPHSRPPAYPGLHTVYDGMSFDSLFDLLVKWGVVHHAYDAAMGAFAKQLDWETWYLPFECQHLGGQTAVGDVGYAKWAMQQRPPDTFTPIGPIAGGDQRFWEEAHRIIWERLGHLLPFIVGDRG